MIPFDFEYYKPLTFKEAIDLFTQLDSENKNPVYFAGGTELISMARVNKVKTNGVIDIKGIPECNVLGVKDDSIIMGSAVTLSQISDSNILPLLSNVIRLAADRTSRNKITLGGNICGKIPYKEAILPFLLLDSIAIIAGPDGNRQVSASQLYSDDLGLQKGEILIQIITNKDYANLPFYHIKRTKQEKVDYPLVSGAFIKEGNRIKFALSGLCKLPFRSIYMEDILNDTNINLEKRINKVIESIENPILNNMLGSAEYRKFVLKNIIVESLQKLGDNSYVANFR